MSSEKSTVCIYIDYRLKSIVLINTVWFEEVQSMYLSLKKSIVSICVIQRSKQYVSMWSREVHSKYCVVQGNLIMYLNGLEKCLCLCGLVKSTKVSVQSREVHSMYLFDLQKKSRYVSE